MPLSSSPSHARYDAIAGGKVALPKLDAWRLIEKIGSGRFCDVFAAVPTESRSDRPAGHAIKLLHDRWDDDPIVRYRMAMESQAGRIVFNAHVVPILGGAVIQASPYLIMPLLTGSTLAHHLAVDSSVELSKCLSIIRQTAEGLAALHEAGWVHGDIKPSNIMIAASGHTTVVDLGFVHRCDNAENTMDGSPFGTLPYAAPERFRSVAAGSFHSDIYSLGMVLHEVVCGRGPYSATKPADWAAAHLESRVEDPRHLRPGLSPRLTGLLLRMLAKQPLRRPTAAEVVDALVPLEIEAMAEWAAA